MQYHRAQCTQKPHAEAQHLQLMQISLAVLVRFNLDFDDWLYGLKHQFVIYATFLSIYLNKYEKVLFELSPGNPKTTQVANIHNGLMIFVLSVLFEIKSSIIAMKKNNTDTTRACARLFGSPFVRANSNWF